jgi:isoquinoline 1-oxidoreductase subunit beta
MTSGAQSHAIVSRRQIMTGAAGLTFALALDAGKLADAVASDDDVTHRTFSPWVTIATDGTVSIMSAAAEMGQGSMTALPLILAEELDADWDKVRVLPAPVIERIYGNPAFGGAMYTAGSTAVAAYFEPLRIFGAQVRRVLLENAAKRLAVPIDELSTERSVVVHAKSKRRLNYGEIAAFAEIPASAPEIKPEELKKPSEFQLIGKDVLRVELPNKVNGAAIYSIDVQIPEMIYGAVAACPVNGGSPDGFDEDKVNSISGVITTVRLPQGIGVLAKTPWAAFNGKTAVEDTVGWNRTGKAWGFDSDKAIENFAVAARDLNVSTTADWFKQGDAEGALRSATTVVETEYSCDYAYHAQMEPLNATAAVSPDGNAAEVWCGSQSPTMALDTAAKALGIPRENITLHYTLLGGSFGRRGHRDDDYIVDAVLLSKASKRPVKVMWTREDDVHRGRLRPLTAHYLRAGLDSSGRIIAWHQRLAGDRVLPYMDPVRYERAGRSDAILMLGVELRFYDIANQYCGQIYRDSGVRTSPLRGIGYTANKFVAEAFLDEIARWRAVDPVELRLELLKNTPRGRAVVQRVARMSGWGTRAVAGRALGFAFIDYSNGLLAGVAEISVNRISGKIIVHNFWCAFRLRHCCPA